MAISLPAKASAQADRVPSPGEARQHTPPKRHARVFKFPERKEAMLHKTYNKAPNWAKFAMEQLDKRGIVAMYVEGDEENWVWGPKGGIVLNKGTHTLSGVRLDGIRVHEGSEISFEAIMCLIRSVLR